MSGDGARPTRGDVTSVASWAALLLGVTGCALWMALSVPSSEEPARAPPTSAPRPSESRVGAAPRAAPVGSVDPLVDPLRGDVELREPVVPAPPLDVGVPAVTDGAPEDVADRFHLEDDVRRRVFSDARGGESPFLGTGRRRAGGTFAGVGNRAPVEGRVTDARSGEPVAGAEVVVATLDEDGWGRRVRAVPCAEDGTFSVHRPVRHADRAVLIVRAPGHVARRERLDAVPELWPLEPLAGSERGSVRGRAETPDGAPLHGLLLVSLRSEHGDSAQQYAWCDAQGWFRLDGLHAGRWRLSLTRARTDEVEVVVPAGGSAGARLVAERPAAPPPERPGADRRTLEVTGLADGTFVRAEAGRDVYWRAGVENGVARFELPLGNWVLRIDRADGAVMPIGVREDDLLRRIPWAPDTGGE